MQSQLLMESQSQSGFPSERRLLPPEFSTPLLVSERLVLRAPEAADTNAIAHLANNINVASKVSRMPHPYTVKDAEAFVARVASGAMGKCVYAVTRSETREFIGCCGLQAQDEGNGLEIGAAWKKLSKAERPYLSVTLDDPSFPATLYARLVEGEDGAHNLIWSRSKGD